MERLAYYFPSGEQIVSREAYSLTGWLGDWFGQQLDSGNWTGKHSAYARRPPAQRLFPIHWVTLSILPLDGKQMSSL